MKLSTRPAEFLGKIETWNHAEAELKRALETVGEAYAINDGDGAFYGPKIDFDVTDAIGRKWQCATIQLDYMMPERFDLKYIGADNAEHRPVVIHRYPDRVAAFPAMMERHRKREGLRICRAAWLLGVSVREYQETRGRRAVADVRDLGSGSASCTGGFRCSWCLDARYTDV